MTENTAILDTLLSDNSKITTGKNYNSSSQTIIEYLESEAEKVSINEKDTLKDINFYPSINPDFSIPEKIKESSDNRKGYSKYFIKQKSWIGKVLKIENDSFKSRLFTPNSERYEEAEFDLEDVSKDDLELLADGAIFYFFIGREKKHRGGQVTNMYRLRFQRVIPWTEEELDNAFDEANKLNKGLNWDEE